MQGGGARATSFSIQSAPQPAAHVLLLLPAPPTISFLSSNLPGKTNHLAAKMPPYLELSNLQRAITAQAMPALGVLADDESQLDHSRNARFERDSPPPYVSSSESESEEALRHPVLARPRDAVLAEHVELLSQPLDQKESRKLVRTLNRSRRYAPGPRYRSEAKLEQLRLSSFCRDLPWKSPLAETLNPTKNTGQKRRAVIIRRIIRKRWQHLGIWNPKWGIPDRVDAQPPDWVDDWTWRWQSDADPPLYDPQHPLSRAVQLRENLDYGERPVPPPRSRLSEDASASEAESFITSRPWFLYSLENFEFRERKARIPWEKYGRPDFGMGDQVLTWWHERGDWKTDWEAPGDDSFLVVGWKWRHESPSPEPEDLSPLITNEMDFTPSEVDALEAVWTPTPSPPGSPQITRPDPPGVLQLFSGPTLPQQPDVVPEDNRVELDVHESDQVQPEDQRVQEAEPDTEPPKPPPQRRGRARKPDQPAAAQSAPQSALPPLRRSARIAAKVAIVPPSAPAAPAAAATKRQATRRSTRAIPAAPPARDVAARSSKKRGGASRKTQDDGVTKPAAAKAKKGGRKPSARASTQAEKKSTPAARTSGRGRGRKTG